MWFREKRKGSVLNPFGAATVAADVAGCSRLMALTEEGKAQVFW